MVACLAVSPLGQDSLLVVRLSGQDKLRLPNSYTHHQDKHAPFSISFSRVIFKMSVTRRLHECGGASARRELSRLVIEWAVA